MDPEDIAEAERRVKEKRRNNRAKFDARVETWLRPPVQMKADLADDLATIMGKDLYALYAKQMNMEAVEKCPEPENMLPQAVLLRENNGRMLVRTVVSAGYGSKWEGDVEVPMTVSSAEFLAECEEQSGLKLKSYTVSFNGRLLTPQNSLYDVGVRDAKKVVILPMGKPLNYRPNWSVRQTEEVAVKMEERHKKMKLSNSTQNLMKGSLGRDLYKTLDTTFNIMDKDEIDPNEDPKMKAARQLKEKKMKDAEFERTDMYDATWEDRPHAEYKKRSLRPLAGFCTDQAKMARASRPLQNYEESMAKSTQMALMGKPDPAVPRLDSLKQWFAAYGESDNFFKAGQDPQKDMTGSLTSTGFINKKPSGVMSRYERSSRRYGKERSNAVTLKTGNLAM